MFAISQSGLDATAFREALEDPRCGACVIFDGRVRNQNQGREVLRLEYEVYRPLAEREGRAILDEAMSQFDVWRVACVHREGLLELGESAVLAGAAAAHRGEAFSACRYVIDEVKKRLPIWKREHYADGERHWVNCKRVQPVGSPEHG